jgi:hypothetical protein
MTDGITGNDIIVVAKDHGKWHHGGGISCHVTTLSNRHVLLSVAENKKY